MSMVQAIFARQSKNVLTHSLTNSSPARARKLHKSIFIKQTVGFSAWKRAMNTSSAVLDLTGIFPPIVTPFQRNEQEEIDFGKLKENFGRWNKIPFKGMINKREMINQSCHV